MKPCGNAPTLTIPLINKRLKFVQEELDAYNAVVREKSIRKIMKMNYIVYFQISKF